LRIDWRISLSLSFSEWGRHDRAVIRGDHSKTGLCIKRRTVLFPVCGTLDTDDDALEDAQENAGEFGGVASDNSHPTAKTK
jgi:hypothetical protein